MGSVATEIRGSVAVVSFDNAARMKAIDAGVAEGLASGTIVTIDGGFFEAGRGVAPAAPGNYCRDAGTNDGII